jgi:hypothetical protein
MTSTIEGWTVSDVARMDREPYVFGRPRPCTSATLTHETGAVMGVSRYDGEPGWGVDSAIGANGMPRWIHGTGERSVSVRMMDDGPVTAELDRRAGELRGDTERAVCAADGCGREATSGEDHDGRMMPVCQSHAV